MKLSNADGKAIAWFIKDRNLKPMLSSPPTMYFVTSEGKQVIHSLSSIVSEYVVWKEEAAKERVREKKIADKQRSRFRL